MASTVTIKLSPNAFDLLREAVTDGMAQHEDRAKLGGITPDQRRRELDTAAKYRRVLSTLNES